MINNKVRHNLVNAKCRWPSNRLDGAGSFREPLGQTKVMQIRQRETQIRQRETTHEICCLATQQPSSICIHFTYYRQPEGCLQYHTTLTGRFQSFNFADSSTPAHLANQKYVCINKTYLLLTIKATQFCLTTA